MILRWCARILVVIVHESVQYDHIMIRYLGGDACASPNVRAFAILQRSLKRSPKSVYLLFVIPLITAVINTLESPSPWQGRGGRGAAGGSRSP